MNKSKKLVIVATLIISICSQWLVTYSRPTATHVALPAGEIRSEAQLRSEASLYDAAINDIRKGTSIKLDTANDLKAATALLNKAIPNLRFNRSKLIVSGMSDTTFVGAVKERTRDAKSTEEFARALAGDQNEILKLNGATALQSRLARSLDADVTLIRSVSDRLKKAADAVKAKTNANHAGSRSYLSSETTTSPTPPGILLDIITLQLVAIAVVVQPAIFLVLVGTGLGSTLVIVGAAVLVAKIIGNVATDKGRDKLAECEDSAQKNFNDCMATANAFDFVIVSTYCTAAYLASAAACLVA
ncbi:MAG: hypothetical protein C5B55_03030 [Blastocatellia bacterium]|nr:MAG: hypothetical protein C5B55_03030 [Blastocatellia bacterium]